MISGAGTAGSCVDDAITAIGLRFRVRSPSYRACLADSNAIINGISYKFKIWIAIGGTAANINHANVRNIACIILGIFNFNPFSY